jgi:hypothetical protein
MDGCMARGSSLHHGLRTGPEGHSAPAVLCSEMLLPLPTPRAAEVGNERAYSSFLGE